MLKHRQQNALKMVLQPQALPMCSLVLCGHKQDVMLLQKHKAAAQAAAGAAAASKLPKLHPVGCLRSCVTSNASEV
jgi:hypothetical protein